jgi:hypothetical protein
MTLLRFACAAAAAATLASVSGPAAGQDVIPEGDDQGWFDGDDEPETVPAEPAPTEPQVVAAPEPDAPSSPAASSPPAAAQPAPADAASARPPDEREPNQGRFRWGISPYFGAARYFRNDTNDEMKFAFGLEARFGGQIDDMLAVYAVPSIIGSETMRVATGVVVEGTFGDIVSVGGGLDAILGSEDDREGPLTPGLGPEARIGVHVGKNRPSRRKAFSMVANLKLDFFTSGDKTIMIGGMAGYDAM